MTRLWRLLGSLSVACLVGAGSSGAVLAQSVSTFPSKPIRILVGFSAGSPSDTLARMVAQRLTVSSGQSVVVENRPSAGAIVATETVARSEPDGYTLLMVSAGHAATAALYRKLSFDSEKDFTGVAFGAVVPEVLVVAPELATKTVAEFLTHVRAQATPLTYSSAGVGSATHLTAELFNSMAGTAMVHVPYRGIPPALNAVVAGEVNLFFAPISNALPMIRDKRVVPLGVTTRERAPSLPDVPSISEGGLPGFQFDPWFGFLAPAATPRTTVEWLNREINDALRHPEVWARLETLGAEPSPMSAGEFDKYVHDQIALMRKIVETQGIHLE